jgi:hypothetical protein
MNIGIRSYDVEGWNKDFLLKRRFGVRRGWTGYHEKDHGF